MRAVGAVAEGCSAERSEHAAGPAIGRREVLGASILGAVLAVAMHWPVVTNLTHALPVWSTGTPGGPEVTRVTAMSDPMLQAWEIAWGGHALLHQPLHYFNANAFWPLR